MFIMLVGSFGMNLNATVAMIPLLICTIAAVLLALVLEFFAFEEITAVQSVWV